MKPLIAIVMSMMLLFLVFYIYDSEKIMKTSDVGVEMIKEFEGKKQVAYQDPAGVWTIGYGHTKGVEKGQLCIEKTCDKFLREDLEEVEEYIDRLVKVELNQNQFDALVAWTFNLGPGNLKESTMLRKLNYGDYESVPEEMRRWNKAGGEVLNGLVRRRDAEANLFSS